MNQPSTGTSRTFCLTHRVLAPAGEPCPQCAAAADPAPIMLAALPAGAYALCPNHDILYHIAIGARCPLCRRAQRDAYDTLEGRVSDLSAENTDLRRRVSALEHLRITDLEIHNTDARELECAQRLVENPLMHAGAKAAAQRVIDRITAERAKRGDLLP